MSALISREILIEKLAHLVPSSDYNSKLLLQAYASFKADVEGVLPELAASLLQLDKSSPFYPEAASAFCAYSFTDFLAFIACDLVCDLAGAERLLLRIEPQPASVVTKCCFILLVHTISSKVEKIPHKREQHLSFCWDQYLKEATLPPVEQRVFQQLFIAICFYPLNPKSYALQSPTKRKAEKAIYTLQQLGETEEHILDYAYRIFTENRTIASQLAALYAPRPDNHPLGKAVYLSQFSRAVMEMMRAEPIDILSGITLLKPTNDITLENDYIYRSFVSSLNPERSENHVTIVGANPFFIRSWLQDKTLRDIEVDFMDFRANYIALLRTNFKTVSPKATFLSAHEWIHNVQDGLQPEDTAALVFAVSLTSAQQQAWLDAWQLLRYQIHAELFILMGTNDFERGTAPITSLWLEKQMQIRSISLMPQNIPSSTAPHRKMLLRCAFSASEKGQRISVNALSLFTLNNNQYLMRKPTVYLSDSEILNAETLRRLYLSALLSNESFSSRQKGFPYEFTPEITIWFSKSWPKNNADRPRLEAYVCQPADAKKLKRGQMPRGKRLPGTIKRKTKVRPEAIDDWLEYQYPFTTVTGRGSGKNPNDPTHDVRQAVIEFYGKQLASQEISLKSLWYLYPEMKTDAFSSAGDYQIFEEMMHTEVGDLKPSELDEHKLLDLFENNAALDESPARPELRLFLLSQAVDFAMARNHCSENLLQQQILEREKSGRNLFSEVRSALAKKNFSKAQLQKIMCRVIDELEHSHFEYLGVLIRLFLGLESNIICALRFGDVEYVADYDFCKLLVYRQLSNDGKTEFGFKKTEDYRCVPIPAVITYHIRKRKEALLTQHPELSAALSVIPLVPSGANDETVSMAPRQLSLLCKDVLNEAAIPDEFIYVPTDDGGVKETNLAHYAGDLFRANFQYYALGTARFTQDEMRYLLGNTPVTTFGRYYCDFLNDAVQFILYRKMMRLEAAFHDPVYLHHAAPPARGSRAVQSPSSFDSPVCLTGSLRLTQSEVPTKLTIRSGFGMDLTAGYLIGGDES